MWSRRTFGWCAFVLVPLALASPVAGQDVSVRAFVSPSGTVAVGRPFILNVEISGTQDVRRDPTLPDLSHFAQYLGSQTQSAVNMVGGRTSITFTIQYRYQALQEGSFEIPTFSVNAGGQSFTTEPISIDVAATAEAPSQDPDTGLGPDDLFITADASATSVLEGEPFVVEYRIWTRVDVTNFGLTNVPEHEGFWVEDVTGDGQAEVEQLTRNGIQYASAVIRRVVLVATGSGERRLEPIGVEAQVRVRRGRDPFRDPFEDFFGRSPLFGSTNVPTTVLSNPLTIDVRPLPAGRPETFSGVVGSLDVTTALDRDSIDANEAVTFTVEVSGRGNLRGVTAPAIDFEDDFEVFPPEVSERVTPSASGISGVKTFEYVLIPRAPGKPRGACGRGRVLRPGGRRLPVGYRTGTSSDRPGHGSGGPGRPRSWGGGGAATGYPVHPSR